MLRSITEQTPLTISELNRQVKHLLEVSFARILVTGEISNFTVPGSGHWYFTLKDDQAQVRCAMFRAHNQKIHPRPKNGDKVVVQAKVSLYPGRGDYQLIVDHLAPEGSGDLHRAFEQLKTKLSAEGLFDPQHKRPLPRYPRRIALVTSATGAAVRDMISVFKKRWPLIELALFPTQVQGEQAADEICQNLRLANRLGGFDAIIVGRGGGSLEDLWPFNEERVARAIFDSVIPVVSAVGHETDTTIADLVADLRAPTPSAAAEILSPDQSEIQQKLDVLETRLLLLVRHRLQQHQERVHHLAARLRSPQQVLEDKQRHIQGLRTRLTLMITGKIQTQQMHVAAQQARLAQRTPSHTIERQAQQIQHLCQRMRHAMQTQLRTDQQNLQRVASKLDALSPLTTLSRGYSVTTQEAGTELVSRITQVRPNNTIRVFVQDGAISARVLDIHPGEQLIHDKVSPPESHS